MFRCAARGTAAGRTPIPSLPCITPRTPMPSPPRCCQGEEGAHPHQVTPLVGRSCPPQRGAERRGSARHGGVCADGCRLACAGAGALARARRISEGVFPSLLAYDGALRFVQLDACSWILFPAHGALSHDARQRFAGWSGARDSRPVAPARASLIPTFSPRGRHRDHGRALYGQEPRGAGARYHRQHARCGRDGSCRALCRADAPEKPAMQTVEDSLRRRGRREGYGAGRGGPHRHARIYASERREDPPTRSRRKTRSIPPYPASWRRCSRCATARWRACSAPWPPCAASIASRSSPCATLILTPLLLQKTFGAYPPRASSSVLRRAVPHSGIRLGGSPAAGMMAQDGLDHARGLCRMRHEAPFLWPRVRVVLRHLRRARRDPCGGPGVAGTVDGNRRGACAALYARVDHRAAGAADVAAKIIIAKKTVIVYNLSSWRSPVFSEE